MKLIFVRHGKTEENLKGIVTGQIPGKLSSLGIKQAKNTAKRLKDAKIAAIYSSDSRRAADTARIIAAFHQNTPLKFTEELEECNLGSLQGIKIDPRFDQDFDNSYCSGKLRMYMVEAPPVFYRRIDKFLRSIYKDNDETVLIVSHSLTFRFIAAVLYGKPVGYTVRVRTIDNDEVPVFEVKMNKKFRSKLIKQESVLHKSILQISYLYLSKNAPG